MTTRLPNRGKAKPGSTADDPAPAGASGGGGPVFSEMSRAAALKLLRSNAIGRIAYSLHDRVEVLPIFYVSDGRWLYVRTSPGFKLDVLTRNRWLALQTDQVESMFSWRSVLVQGTVYVLSPDATPDLARRYSRAIRKIRELLPATLTIDDPVAFRSVFLGIHIDRITGRQAQGSSPRGRRLRSPRSPRRSSSRS